MKETPGRTDGLPLCKKSHRAQGMRGIIILLNSVCMEAQGMRDIRSTYEFRAGCTAVRLLKEAGHEAYFVGGCVRDELTRRMSRPSAEDIFGSCRYARAMTDEPQMRGSRGMIDIDIATSATPEEMMRVFHGMKVIETGIKHGTITLLAAADGGDMQSESGADQGAAGPGGMEFLAASGDTDESVLLVPLEITTYRTESGYSDCRHPDSVGFTRSLEEDLKRRDFTVNALVMDENGSVTDILGVSEDLRNRVLRAVGDPDERFREDALRIMRAMRFASVLGFRIEEKTEAAMFRNGGLLKKLSVERVFSEFRKLVTGKYAPDVVRRYIDVLGEVFPELYAMKGFDQRNKYHKYDVLEHCIHAMEAVRTSPENREHMKTAALFHDIGKPLTYSPDDTGRGHFFGHAAKGAEVTAEIMKRFKVDKAFADRVVLLVKYHDMLFERDERLLKKWMRKFTPEVLFEILAIKFADNLATGNMTEALKVKFSEIEMMMRGILEQEQCFSLKDLAVGGSDLLAAGMEPGPAVGVMLEVLLEKVTDGELENSKAVLMAEAERIMSANHE